jgi:hypothetical protein
VEFVEQVSVAAAGDEDVEGPAEELDDGFACCGHGSWCERRKGWVDRVSCERWARSEQAVHETQYHGDDMCRRSGISLWSLRNETALVIFL